MRIEVVAVLKRSRKGLIFWIGLYIFGSMDPNIIAKIANVLEQEIFSGHLRPGDPLQQEVLAKRFDVSRQPVRAALKMLEAKNLVSRGSDRSLTVLGLPETASSEIIDVRRLLEPQALKLAMSKLTDRDLVIARHALERCEIEENPLKLSEHDLDFHMALYRPCGNQTLLQLIEDLRRTSTRAYFGQPPGSMSRQATNESHHAIHEACVARKRKDACTHLLNHLNHDKDRNT